jgi:hypothetical protein
MLVVVGDRRVVVVRDPRNAALPYERHRLVGPGGVADEIPEVVHRADLIAGVYVREHGFEGGQVGVDDRDQSVLHLLLRSGRLPSIKNSLYVF